MHFTRFMHSILRVIERRRDDMRASTGTCARALGRMMTSSGACARAPGRIAGRGGAKRRGTTTTATARAAGTASGEDGDDGEEGSGRGPSAVEMERMDREASAYASAWANELANTVEDAKALERRLFGEDGGGARTRDGRR